ncbi:HNH endonuclease signature motif containing protein [Prauserella alba]|uniref:HNH endonuclease signature motif containing protein n=1 Tax=Prauserella alba TaxID=176898 RepID=A0ABP4G043_9PSEU|nr:HNH endonuclease signature motif containing protein [Prauserella alba]MCP2183571.1 protein of unknown function (DUF222) [Prauserella alba]
MDGGTELDEMVRIERAVARLHARFVDAAARFVAARGRTEESAAEVGVALGWTGRFARQRLELAEQLVSRLPRTLDALARGEIDLVKASQVAGPTAALPDTLATRVDQLVAGRLDGATAGSIQRLAKKTVLDVDPGGQAERAQQERTQRHVRLSHNDGSTATLAAELPAETAQAAYARVDTAARTLRRSGDRRSLDQLRADVYSDLLLGRSDTASAAALPAEPLSPPATTSPPSKADVFVHIDLATLTGLADNPAELAGHGPLPAPVARAIAHDPASTWRRIVTDPHTGVPLDVGRTRYRPPKALADYVKVRDRTCRFPGCHRPSDHVDLDHVIPHSCEGPTCAANLIGLCRHHHRVKHTPGWTFRLEADGTVHITTPTGRRIAAPPPHEKDLGTRRTRNGTSGRAGTNGESKDGNGTQEPQRRPGPHTGRRRRGKARNRRGRGARSDAGPPDNTTLGSTATGTTNMPADSAD